MLLFFYSLLAFFVPKLVLSSSPLSYFLSLQPSCSSLSLKDDSQFPILLQMSTSAKEFFSSPIDIRTSFTNDKDIHLDNTEYLVKNQNLLIFVVFLLMIFIVVLCSCCCQAFCMRKLQLCYRCCRIDLEETRPTNKEKYCLLSCLIFILLLIGLVIAFMILNHDMTSAYKTSYCTLNNLAIEILNPQNLSSYANLTHKERDNMNWRGSIPISEDLRKASTIFPLLNASKDLHSLSKIQINGILTKLEAVRQKDLVNSLEQYHDSKLINPNPLSQENGLKSSILSNWGPSSKEGAFLYPLHQEIYTRKVFLEKIKKFGVEAGELERKTDEFTSKYAESAKNIEDFGVNMSLALRNKVEMLEKNQKYMDYVELLPIWLAAGNGLPGLMIILGFVLIVCCKCKCFNIFLHCSWIISLLLVLIMTLSAFHIFILGHSISKACTSLETAFTNQKPYFQEMKEFNWPETEIISSSFCLFEQKNLSVLYNFEAYLDKPNEMYNSLQQLILKQMEFANSAQIMQKIKDFTVNYEDFAGEAVSQDHPTNVLVKMNLWSNSESLESLQEKQGFCAVTTDQYVFKEADCVYPKKFISLRRNGYKFGLGENICISFEKIPVEFSQKRYDDIVFRSCFSAIESFGTVKNAINGYFSGLFKYKNETISKLNEIFSKVEQLRKEEAGVDKEIAGKVQEVQDASKKLKELFGLVSGRNGVENNLNCSFVRERAKNFTNSMCVTGMNGLFFFYISLIALICFQIIISFLGCWAAIRLVHFDSEDIERQGLINKDKNPEMQISSVLY